MGVFLTSNFFNEQIWRNKPIALFEDLEPTTDYQSTKEILDLRKVLEDFSSAAGMVNVEKIDQRRHFFGGSLSTLTSLFQRQ